MLSMELSKSHLPNSPSISDCGSVYLNLSFIDRLPPELLSKIFVDRIDLNTQVQDICHILTVCRRWRSVGLKTPQLFTYLFHDYDSPDWSPSNVNPNLLIPNFLRRSGALPIDLKINFASNFDYKFVPRYGGPWVSSDCLEVLKYHLPRCRSIHFWSMDLRHLETFMPNGTAAHLPQLRELNIKFCTGYGYLERYAGDYFPYAPRPNLGKWYAPQLEKLNIGRYGWQSREALKLSPINFIIMEPMNITVLELSYLTWDMWDYMDVLQMFPNLEKCIMHTDFHRNIEATTTRRTALVHLSELTLKHHDARQPSDSSGMNPFLQELYVPHLECLCIVENRLFEQAGNYSAGFLSLFTSDETHFLKRLTLRDVYIFPATLFAILSKAPFLEYLYIGGSYVTLEDAIITGLTPNAIEPWKWDNLSFIHLGNCSGDKLLQLIQAHVSSYENGSPSGLRLLELERLTKSVRNLKLNPVQGQIRIVTLPPSRIIHGSSDIIS